MRHYIRVSFPSLIEANPGHSAQALRERVATVAASLGVTVGFHTDWSRSPFTGADHALVGAFADAFAA